MGVAFALAPMLTKLGIDLTPPLARVLVAILDRLAAEIEPEGPLARFNRTAQQIVDDQMRLAPPGTTAEMMLERAQDAIRLFAAKTGVPVSEETVTSFTALIAVSRGE